MAGTLELPIVVDFRAALNSLMAQASQNIAATAGIAIGFGVAWYVLARGMAWVEGKEQQWMAYDALDALRKQRGMTYRSGERQGFLTPRGEEAMERIFDARNNRRLRRTRRGRVRYD